jgi:hypothetical protein
MPSRPIVIEVERDAKLGEPGDCGGRSGDDMLDHFEIVEPGPGNHRVANVGVEAVALFEDGGDPALRPFGRAASQWAFGEDGNLAMLGKVKRSGKSGRAGADDDNVVIAHATSRVSVKKTSSRSGSLVETSTIS